MVKLRSRYYWIYPLPDTGNGQSTNGDTKIKLWLTIHFLTLAMLRSPNGYTKIQLWLTVSTSWHWRCGQTCWPGRRGSSRTCWSHCSSLPPAPSHFPLPPDTSTALHCHPGNRNVNHDIMTETMATSFSSSGVGLRHVIEGWQKTRHWKADGWGPHSTYKVHRMNINIYKGVIKYTLGVNKKDRILT